MRNRGDDTVDVLLVEDESEATRRIEAAFDGLDIETSVRVATDGTEALDHLTGENADAPSLPDLVLLDLQLPGMDGLEVLEALADEPTLRRLPVLVLTRPGDAEDIHESYELGANASLAKPAQPEGYSEMVEAVAEFWFRRAALPTTDG